MRTLRTFARLLLVLCALMIMINANAFATRTVAGDCDDIVEEASDEPHVQMAVRLYYSAEYRLFYGAEPPVYRRTEGITPRDGREEHGQLDGAIYRLEYNDPVAYVYCSTIEPS